MQWVKLIGGPHGGQVQKVDDDQLELFRQVLVPVSARAVRRGLSLAAADCTATRHRYTRRCVGTPDDKIFYFALDALSDGEALRHALAP